MDAYGRWNHMAAFLKNEVLQRHRSGKWTSQFFSKSQSLWFHVRSARLQNINKIDSGETVLIGAKSAKLDKLDRSQLRKQVTPEQQTNRQQFSSHILCILTKMCTLAYHDPIQH